MLYIAYKGLLNIKSCKFEFVVYAGIFYTIVILVTEFVMVPAISDIDRVLSNSDIIINIVAMIGYSYFIYAYSKAKPEMIGGILGVIFVCVFAECMFSSEQGLDRTTDREAYVKYIDGADEAVDYMNDKENGNFYRTEFRRFTSINDAALYHYRGFSQFSSLAPGGISDFIGNLGIAATGNSYRYYDPTPLVDAMFDIKYVMNKDGEINKERYVFEQQFNNVWVYRNDRVLPLGFIVNSDIKNWQTEDSQPFEVQNNFIKQGAGINKDMFTPIKADSVEKTFMNVTEQTDDNSFKYELTDPANLSLEPTVKATFTSDKDQYVYVYVDAGNAKRVKYQTNTANEDRELSAGKSLFDIGYVSAGETINVEFALTNKGEFEKTYRKTGTVKIYAASYNDSVFQEAYDKLNQNTYNITKFEDTHIEGTVNSPTDGVIFTSIPYVDGWKVTVDGKAVDKVSIGNNGVIGVDVPAGEHTVVFQFKSKGLIPSLVISLVGLILAVLYTIVDNKFKKKKELKLVAAAAFAAEVNEIISNNKFNKKNKKKR